MQTEFTMIDRATTGSIVPMRVRPRAKTLDLSPAKTIELIEKCIRMPPEGPIKVTITPEVAAVMLKLNLHNRTKKTVKINQYAADMKIKDWRETDDPIKFGDNGLLRDGQNRLYACVQAGVPFENAVTFGIPERSFTKMDQGKNRSGGDVLTIAGYSDANNLANACRWVSMFEAGTETSRAGLTPEQTLIAAQTYEGLSEFVKIAGRIYNASGQPKGFMAALLYTLNKRNPVKAMEWAHAWENNVDGGKFRGIGLATTKLGEVKRISGGRVNEVIRAAFFVKAWNMFVTGQRPRKDDMVWSPGDEFPEILG